MRRVCLDLAFFFLRAAIIPQLFYSIHIAVSVPAYCCKKNNSDSFAKPVF